MVWGGAGVSAFFFTENPNLKKNIFFCGGGWGVGPKPICPFHFFEVGSITMNKCTSYGPDKLNLCMTILSFNLRKQMF